MLLERHKRSVFTSTEVMASCLTAAIHHLSQCWDIAPTIFFTQIIKRSSNIFIQRKVFENTVCMVTAILRQEALGWRRLFTLHVLSPGASHDNNRGDELIWHLPTVTSQWASRHLKSPATRLLVNRLFRLKPNNIIKARVIGPLWGESTGERRIPPTKGQ